MGRSRSTFCAALCILIAGLCTTPASRAAEERPAVPILVYHRFGPTVADSMTVTTAVLEEQLAWLRAHDYRIIPLRLLLDSLRNPADPVPPRAVVITADDGHESVYREMWPLIRRYRFPVTLFIYPSAISNASYALTWEQLRTMRDTGLIDIQSHTYWHPNFRTEQDRLSPADYDKFVTSQLVKSRDVLASRLGRTVDLLAWPYGIHDGDLPQRAARAGYVAAFALGERHARDDDDIMALPRYLMAEAYRGPAFAKLLAGRPQACRGRPGLENRQ
jgi:peptidoglycan/xylan/chitin deacetylase (PgdA/CDA1 family)